MIDNNVIIQYNLKDYIKMSDYFNRVDSGNYYLHRHALDVYELSDDDYFWVTIDEEQFSGQGVSLLSDRDVIIEREMNLFDSVHNLYTQKNEYNERRNR